MRRNVKKEYCASILFNTSCIHTDSAWIEPRLCDYSGLYYCQRCHWNTAMVIPARVIRNWDMEPRLVSRVAAQLLTLLEERSVLLLEELNPKLFTLIPDLSLVKVRTYCNIELGERISLRTQS